MKDKIKKKWNYFYYVRYYYIHIFLDKINELILKQYHEDDTLPIIQRYILIMTDDDLEKRLKKLERKQKKKRERLYKREELQKKILKKLRIVDDTYETKRERKEREKREKLEKYFNISNKTDIKEKK